MEVNSYKIESGADLAGADLAWANLKGANLQGADLQGADLNNADLAGAKLQGANLQGADLSNANLKGANLQGTDLYEADLSGAILSKGTRKMLSSQWVKGIEPSQQLLSVVLGKGLEEEVQKAEKYDNNQQWRYDDTTDEHVLYSRWDTDDFGRTVETNEFGVQRRVDD